MPGKKSSVTTACSEVMVLNVLSILKYSVRKKQKRKAAHNDCGHL